jgi:hypothetical protein
MTVPEVYPVRARPLDMASTARRPEVVETEAAADVASPDHSTLAPSEGQEEGE